MEAEARSADMQSPEVAVKLCARCIRFAKDWEAQAERLWEERIGTKENKQYEAELG